MSGLNAFIKRVGRSARYRIMAGVAVLVPIGITIWILRLVFEWLSGFLTPTIRDGLRYWIDGKTSGSVEQILLNSTNIIAPIVAILLLVGLLYATGVVARMVIGRRVIDLGEKIVLKIPIVRSVYGASKQVVQAISLPNRTAFKAVVMVNFPCQWTWSLAFLTGTIRDQTGRVYYKVFIPTSPNPTTGFFSLTDEKDIRMTDIPVEEAFKMIISGGIIAPETINHRPVGSIECITEPAIESEAD